MNSLLLLTDYCETDSIRVSLGRSGFNIDTQPTVPADLDAFDLILVDVEEKTSCVEFVRQIRDKSNVPLIALAASGGITECVLILEMGADDFVRKPVDELELLARVKSLLRRSRLVADLDSKVVVVGDIELHSEARTVKKAAKPVHLTAVEFDLLRMLLQSAGTLVTREVISREVFRRRSSSCNRSIDVHMSGLRRKLGPRADDTERIRTIRGYGYIYANGEV